MPKLTATPRAGFHRYTYPANQPAKLVIDLAHTIHGHRNPITELRVINDREVEGLKRTRGWAQNHHVYFHAKFNRPFTCTALREWQRTNREVGGCQRRTLRRSCTLLMTLRNAVLAKVGVSAVDYEGARKNVDAEIPDWDFSQVRKNAKAAWKNSLSAIDVNGGTEDEQTIFYTALYHSAISPNLFSDVDNRYRGVDQQIHTAQNGPMYTVFSLWDTFRALHPLLTVVEPERNEAFIRTLLTQYDQGGLLA